MRTTIRIDDDVFQAAKALAEGSRRPLGVVISELARRGLRPEPVRFREGEIPTFEIPAGAEVIPGNRASEVIAEEGVD